jgi:hypothetical protein
MNEWGDPNLPPPYKQRRVDGAAVALGIVAAIAIAIVDTAAGAVVPFVGFVLGIGSVALAIWLCTQPHPFRKGLGVGILVGYAIIILLIGACFALFLSSGSFE